MQQRDDDMALDMDADTSFPTLVGADSSEMRGGIPERDIVAERAELDRAIAGQTLCTALAHMAERRPDEAALTWTAAGSGWEALTWRRYRDQVRDCALGLRALGVAPGSFGVILTRNRPEHVIASHGLVHALGTPVGLYPTLAPAQVAYIADHCAARVAVVEAAFLPMLHTIRPALPTLEWVVVVGENDGGPHDDVVGWEEVLQRGQEAHQRSPHAFDEATRQVTPDDLAPASRAGRRREARPASRT